MKFDVEIPQLNGVTRLEIRSVREETGWSSYLGFVSDRGFNSTCLLLGESGLPFRFTGSTEQEATEEAKVFLQKKYRVVRIIW
jgi:hypothetical protein